MARTTGNQQDVFDILTREHRVVTTMLEAIAQSCERSDFEQAEQLFATAKQKLVGHLKGEEQAVYPKLREASEELSLMMAQAVEEHGLVEQKIEELSSIAVEDESWAAKLAVAKDLVDHHLEEEEGKVFPSASKVMSAEEARKLGEEFLEAKLGVLGIDEEPITEYDLKVMTKDELVEMAREQGLQISSSMTKDELVEAMSAQQ